MKIVLFFALFLFAVSGQFVTRIVIDNYGLGQGDGVAVDLTTTIGEGDPPLIITDSFDFGPGCVGILGCARDMELRVSKGLPGRSFTSEIISSSVPRYEGNWFVEAVKSSIIFASIEYDGNDGVFDGYFSPDGFTLSFDQTGAAGVDLTDGGLSTALEFICVTDSFTTLTVVMFDLNGAECRYRVPIDAVRIETPDDETISSQDLDEGEILNCDLTQIGYIQTFVIDNDVGLNLFVRRAQVIGNPNPSGAVSIPLSTTVWSLYFPACISWNEVAEGMISIILRSPESDFLIATTNSANSQYEWPAIFGIIPGDSYTIVLVDVDSNETTSEEFRIVSPSSAVSNTCVEATL